MIRQAHTYLVGAMSGATLIAVAIAVFVVLVSAQVFKDWPIAALGDSGGEAASVSKAQPARGSAVAAPATGSAKSSSGGGSGGAATAHGGGSAGTAGGGDGVVAAAGHHGHRAAGLRQRPLRRRRGLPGRLRQHRLAAEPRLFHPQRRLQLGRKRWQLRRWLLGAAPAAASTTGTTSPSSAIAETVDDTVSGVDEAALGGTLGNAGVTGVAESVVNGVAGPESTVGKAVDETVGAVGGLLGGKR